LTDDRVDILSLDRAGLEGVVRALEQPAFRVSQLVRWLYRRGASSFEEMTDLPDGLRNDLGLRYSLVPPDVVARQESADGTRKYLLRFADGVSVETVGLPASERLTVCFSTQAGCAMGCAFCATGQGGLVRGLGPGEMVAQVLVAAADFGRRVTNAVAMGQGEPFAQYDQTIGALRLLNDPDGLGIGARHITISTSGLLPGVRRLAGEPEQFTLAVSLHSAVQATRDRLMPGLRTYPLSALRSTLSDYFATSGRRPTLEYALIGGVNDTDAELTALVGFTRGLPFHVNLIPVNPVAGTGAGRPDARRVEVFRRALTDAGVEASVRVERGADIDAACGQLKQRHDGEV
jgi:23S rRNA (adenine2503-C2)-methyltransferase